MFHPVLLLLDDASTCFVVCDNYGLFHFVARLDQFCRSNARKVLWLKPGPRALRKIQCPRELNVSWLLRPPFATNSGENASQVRGMFHYVFDLALNKCCAILDAGTKTIINFKTQALNRYQLHNLILNDSVHLILPVQSDEDKIYKKNLPFIKILDSPGVVLIQRSNLTQHSSWMMTNREIWNAISSCLPIVALTILLSFVAGISVWMMVSTKHNLEEGELQHPGPVPEGTGDWMASPLPPRTAPLPPP